MDRMDNISSSTFSPSTGIVLLTGEYQHSMDSKGRVCFPSKLRRQIDSFNEQGGISSFCLIMGPNGILGLYPRCNIMQMLCAYASGKGIAPDESTSFERLGFAMGCKVELDNKGRLLLNERVRKRANLVKGGITFIGVGDRVEIWKTDNWESYYQDFLSSYLRQVKIARMKAEERQNQHFDGS